MSTYYVLLKRQDSDGTIWSTAFDPWGSMILARATADLYNARYAGLFSYFIVPVDEEELTCS